MGVAFWCVQEEVAYPSARDMLMLLRNVGKDNSVGYFRACPRERCLLEIGLAQVWEA